MPQRRRFKLRVQTTKNPKGQTNKVYSIGLPEHLGDKIPQGTIFEPVLTEDGILYRRITEQQPQPPSWTNQ